MINYTNNQVLVPPFVTPDVAGVTFGGFVIDKYINSQPNATPAQGSPDVAHSGAVGAVPGISRGGVPVWDYITLPQSMIAAANKGKYWHLATAFQWASMAHLSKKLGTLPNGGNSNTNPPKDYAATTEIALLDKHLNAETPTYYRALPGTGPKNWSHNHLTNGVWDLNGLVWEWNMGLFLRTDGTVDVLPTLDATATGSPYGRGTISGSGGATPTLTCDGAGLVNWLKQWTPDAWNGMQVYIAEASGGAGAFYAITGTTATTLALTGGDAPGDGTATFCVVKHVATDITAGMTSGNKILTLRDADVDLKGFAIPATADAAGAAVYGNDVYYYDKAAVRAALRGGYFYNDALAGVFALALNNAPSASYCPFGFRAGKAL